MLFRLGPAPLVALLLVISHHVSPTRAHAEAQPDANADAEADASAQQQVYAPFSGAIYVVGSAPGYVFNQASPAICPNNAPQSCGAINVWNWCCNSGETCARLSNGIIGCCPVGQTCSGNVQAAAATVTQYVQTTVYVQQTPVYVQPTTVNVVPGVYVARTTNIVYNGYCSTLTARGPNLPTTAAGQCGTILVVNGGERRGGGRLLGVGLGWMGVITTGLVLVVRRWL